MTPPIPARPQLPVIAMTPAELAASSGVGINTIRSAIAKRELRSKRIGRRLIVTTAAACDWLERLPDGPGELPGHLVKRNDRT